MVGRSTHKGQASRVVHSIILGQRLEGGKSLIVIHGQHRIETAVHAGTEKAIGCEGAVAGKTGIDKRLDGGGNHLVLLLAYHAAIAGMGVESQYGYTRRGNAKVAAQRVVQQAGLLGYALFGDRKGHFGNGEMGRDQRHAHQTVAQNHERLGALVAQAGLQIFGMARKAEVGALYALLVDGGGDQHVNATFLEVVDGLFERHEGCMSGLGCRNAIFHLYLIVGTVDQIELPFGGFIRIGHDAELRVQPQCLGMVSGYLGMAIYNRCTQLQHGGFGKHLQDDFPAHTVGIALGDANAHTRRAHFGLGRCSIFLLVWVSHGEKYIIGLEMFLIICRCQRASTGDWRRCTERAGILSA